MHESSQNEAIIPAGDIDSLDIPHCTNSLSSKSILAAVAMRNDFRVAEEFGHDRN